MKKLATLMLVLLALIAPKCAAPTFGYYWTNYPIVITLNGPETFLVSQGTNMAQISAADLLYDYLIPNIPPGDTNFLSYNQAVQVTNISTLIAGNISSNGDLSITNWVKLNFLATNLWANFIGGAPFTTLSSYLPYATWYASWGGWSTNILGQFAPNAATTPSAGATNVIVQIGNALHGLNINLFGGGGGSTNINVTIGSATNLTETYTWLTYLPNTITLTGIKTNLGGANASYLNSSYVYCGDVGLTIPPVLLPAGGTTVPLTYSNFPSDNILAGWIANTNYAPVAVWTNTQASGNPWEITLNNYYLGGYQWFFCLVTNGGLLGFNSGLTPFISEIQNRKTFLGTENIASGEWQWFNAPYNTGGLLAGLDTQMGCAIAVTNGGIAAVITNYTVYRNNGVTQPMNFEWNFDSCTEVYYLKLGFPGPLRNVRWYMRCVTNDNIFSGSFTSSPMRPGDSQEFHDLQSDGPSSQPYTTYWQMNDPYSNACVGINLPVPVIGSESSYPVIVGSGTYNTNGIPEWITNQFNYGTPDAFPLQSGINDGRKYRLRVEGTP
jgi:hypothetical protein